MFPQIFRRKILTWYRRNARHDLPWRQTRDSYRILVAEVMLQQTQVVRVLDYYRGFLQKFPTVRHLARAPLGDVLALWSGLGYNRRARYLWEAAQVVVRAFAGTFPRDAATLETLPGVGPYTANAVCCFSGGACEPFLETNIRRVMLYYFFPRSKNVSDKKLLATLKRIAPRTNQRDWYLALMDYGALAMGEVENPNRRAKNYTRQSKFEGSNRELRGKILRILLTEHSATVAELQQGISPLPHLQKMASVLATLRNDGLVSCPASLTARSLCGIVDSGKRRPKIGRAHV